LEAAAVDRAIALLEDSVGHLANAGEKEKLQKSIDALKKVRAGKKTTKKSRLRKKKLAKGTQATTTPEGKKEITEGGKKKKRTDSTEEVGRGAETVLIDPGELPATPDPVKDARLAATLAHEGVRLRQNNSWPLEKKDWTMADHCEKWKKAIEALRMNKLALKAIQMR